MLAATRGYSTGGSGVPDEARAAKIILNEYVNGEILHFELPEKFQ